jgi:hypothetical protein
MNFIKNVLTAAEKMNAQQFVDYNKQYNAKLKAEYLAMAANKSRYTEAQIDSKRLECRMVGVFV